MARVSVIIPTYNRRDHVQEAIHHALAQVHASCEGAVADGDSTNGTDKALRGAVRESYPV